MIVWQLLSFDVKFLIGWEDVLFVLEEKCVKDIMGVQDFYQWFMKLMIFMVLIGNVDGYGLVRQFEVSFGFKQLGVVLYSVVDRLNNNDLRMIVLMFYCLW